MSERITEAGLRELEAGIAEHAKRDPEAYRLETEHVSAKLLANVVAEVRRLRGLIVGAAGEDFWDSLNPWYDGSFGSEELEAEARAIREEQGR